MCAWLKQSVPTYASWYRSGNVLFNTLSYLVFLIVIVSAYWVLPRGWRVWLVLGASLLFYALWRWEFVFLISFSAFVDYFFSLRIYASTNTRRRRWLMIASVSINLGLLLYFKYTYFILDNFARAGAIAGQDWRLDPGIIVLPLGISFYTFLSISYTIDVYRRLFEPVRHFPAYLAYVLFWPHMIAGPILRAHELLPQLLRARKLRVGDIAEGIRMILFGLFLKVVLADNIAPLADAAFATEPAKLAALDVWTMAFTFGLQIYFDFAGYSMIAVGSARLLGVWFPENFNWPYLATSPREFWKRWHITLSSWIRDYLYLPLTGKAFRDRSEGGLEVQFAQDSGARAMTAALFLTWFVMGLWHGASWNFAFWGLWHAAIIYAYRLVSRVALPLPSRAVSVIGWSATLVFSMLGWIWFRAGSLSVAIELYARLFDFGSYGKLNFRENFYLVTALLLVAMLVARWVSATWIRLREGRSWAAVAEVPVYAVAFMLVFIFLRPINQFIYFQF